MQQRTIKTVPNQKIITVRKEPADRQHIYSTNNIQALYEALYNLTSTVGFKLYMYIAKNQNEYEFALSSADFCNKANCGIRAYNTAVAELESKGYLIKEKGTIYNFYEKARPGEVNKPIEVEEDNAVEVISETEVEMKIKQKTFGEFKKIFYIN